MRKLEPAFIGRHLARVGPMALNSVGAYQIEGEGIQLFEKIEGDYFTIVGLPLLAVLKELRAIGRDRWLRRHEKAFVCGHPIAHSRSPTIHGYWLKTYGIAGSYEAIDVDARGCGELLRDARGRRGFAGGNVTIPHKEAAFAAAARRDEAAEKIGAVNTLWFEDGVLCGGNTDAAGFAANLDERAPGWAKAGTRGGARRGRRRAGRDPGAEGARLHRHQGDQPDGCARRRTRRPFRPGRDGACLRRRKELLGDAGLLVNTTALGMAGKAGADELPADPRSAARACDRYRHRLCPSGDAAARSGASGAG